MSRHKEFHREIRLLLSKEQLDQIEQLATQKPSGNVSDPDAKPRRRRKRNEKVASLTRSDIVREALSTYFKIKEQELGNLSLS